MFNLCDRNFSFFCLHRDNDIHCWRLLASIIRGMNVFHTFDRVFFLMSESFFNLFYVINDYCFVYN